MRGLLAIEPLYHQIVKGAKTQTRRSSGLELVNGHKATKDKAAIIANPDEWEETGSSFVHTKSGVGLESVDFCNYKRTLQNITCKPRYRVGEVLYLKEPITIVSGSVSEKEFFIYKYDTAERDRCNFKWSNKLFMPQDDARAFVKITGIKCERLLDISDEDCIAEGIEHAVSIPLHGERYVGYKNYMRSKNGGIDMLHSCEYYLDMFPNRPDLSAKKSSFLSLYKFANKVKTIDNIWVFCYTFQYLADYKL